MTAHGIVAAGHKHTALAAATILENGGNAFDAIVAAHYAACVCEPVLASLGGGGYMMARTANNTNAVYDFFVQTPGIKRHHNELDFYPISADFGTTQQEFHIGYGAIATPGTVKGLFAIHNDLCTLPMKELVSPAIELARQGVRVNGFQAYIFDIIQSIYTASAPAREIFCSKTENNKLLQEGETLLQPELADCLESLALEGEELFYQGELASQITRLCNDNGGHLCMQDLQRYRVIKSGPLSLDYHKTRIHTNPPPSSGGILIAFALKLLEEFRLSRHRHGSFEHLFTLINTMELTNKARLDRHFRDSLDTGMGNILNPAWLARYSQQLKDRAHASRGTTHISVIDASGNMAGLTTSNGEGCGHLLAGSGIMLNNMLGEEDINPEGFHQWRPGQRMSSMMSPTIALRDDGSRIVLGSGGSNRIRTAILQVLVNLVDYHMQPKQAVDSPRIHFENGLLNIEPGYREEDINRICREFSNVNLWDQHNLFFGGAHTVMEHDGVFSGVGDSRRGGVCMTV